MRELSGLVRLYRSRFFAALDAIGARPVQAATKLSAYARIYADVLRLGRMCLCGMLAAGHETLPTPMRKEVVQFFEENERWLVGVLEQGRSEGAFGFTGSAAAAARSIISGLEGAMLTARLFGDVDRFESDAARLIGSAAGTTPRARSPRAKGARRTG